MARLAGLPLIGSVILAAVQVVAAVYFLIDGMDEAFWQFSIASLLEALVAIALIAGVIVNAMQVRRLLIEARHRDAALDLARGAFSDVVARRFAQWHLSAAESEVALFALKGCTIAEIAEMRGAASGTVRSQLSQVYAKAGVTSQSTLISSFIDELLG